ncbi:MAG: tyrosine-type recombinase/integrase [Clostridia bacterium]|nr:tyrosine-type recombinase/integrase [Clostridia bacterium]
MLYAENFAEYLAQNKKSSANTVASYIRDLKKFNAFISAEGKDFLTVSKKTVNSYISAMQQDGQAASSVLRSIASLRSFYRYLIDNGRLSENPVDGVNSPKLPERNISVLTSKETDLLLNQPVACGFKGCRDKAMLELLYATGLKVTELIALKLSDLNLEGSSISCGSGVKKRTIPLGGIAANAIAEYLPLRESNMHIDETNDCLFVNVGGGTMSRQGFWKIIKFYADKAKIKKDITPGTLRHSFAVHLIENGADVSAVQEMLGHTAEFSTKIYSDVVNGRLGNVYKKTKRK